MPKLEILGVYVWSLVWVAKEQLTLGFIVIIHTHSIYIFIFVYTCFIMFVILHVIVVGIPGHISINL